MLTPLEGQKISAEILKLLAEKQLPVIDCMSVAASLYVAFVAAGAASPEEARTIIREFTQDALQSVGRMWLMADKANNPEKYKTEETPNKNRSIYLD